MLMDYLTIMLKTCINCENVCSLPKAHPGSLDAPCCSYDLNHYGSLWGNIL